MEDTALVRESKDVEMSEADGDTSARTPGVRTVMLEGIAVAAVTESEVVEHVSQAWLAGSGGAIVTLNVDIMRLAGERADARALLVAADLVVADGMPILWAAALAGHPLPARVTGASLLWTLTEAAAAAGQSIFILGGPPGAADAACLALSDRFPGVVVAGTSCPPFGFEAGAGTLDAVKREVIHANPGLVLVGLGFPKQETVIAHLRPHLPATWFLGCGAAVAFASGDLHRAPVWMQRSGLEWFHRLVTEPRRLSQRYLRHDLPAALILLSHAAAAAWALRRSADARTSASVPRVPHQRSGRFSQL